MDAVRTISYVVGGIICGALLGEGVVSLIPIESLNNTFFIALPLGGAIVGACAGFFIAYALNNKATQSIPTTQQPGLSTPLTGRYVVTIVIVGILLGLFFLFH